MNNTPAKIPWDSVPMDYKVGTSQIIRENGTLFERIIKVNTGEQRHKGWEAFNFHISPNYWQYLCPMCGSDITPGPSGGGTNQVCEKCHINFGCLPGALQR